MNLRIILLPALILVIFCSNEGDAEPLWENDIGEDVTTSYF